MSVTDFLRLAEDSRREARRERFANGESALYLALLGVAGAADRAAAELARHANQTRWGQSLATWERSA